MFSLWLLAFNRPLTNDLSMRRDSFDPATGTFDVTKPPFNSVAASNVAYVMWKDSRKASCAVTTNCKAGSNVLFCQFTPSLTADDKPFT